MGIFTGLDPYKSARLSGRADMRDAVLKELSDAAMVSEGKEADLLWHLIQRVQLLATAD